MKTKSVKYIYLTEDGHKKERVMTYRINDSGQVEKVEYHDHFIEYHFLPDGKIYEEITIYDNGDIYKVRYDYDDEGGLIGTVMTDKYGGIVSKSDYNWIKPYRVVQIKDYEYQGAVIETSQETNYYRRDGQLKFKRGLERFTKYEYDDDGHLIKEIESYCVDSGEELIWLTHYWIYNKDELIVEYSDELGNIYTMEYEYEKDGNWIRMEGHVGDVPIGGWICVPAPSFVIRKMGSIPGHWTKNDNQNST